MGDHVQAKHRTHLACAPQLELTQAAPLFDPAKQILVAAAGVDRLGVALVAGSAAIDGGTSSAGGVLCHVRRHADAAHLGDKAPGVEVLIGTDGFLVGTGTIRRHRLGSIPLPGARGLRHLAIDDQGMAVVHEHMAVAPQGAPAEPVARLGQVSIGFPGQQGVGITAGAVGLVAELDAAEITLGTLLALFGLPKTLARPDGGAVDRPDRRSAPARHGMPRPAAGFHPLKGAHR